MPAMEIIATQNKVTVLDHEKGTRSVTQEHDPMQVDGSHDYHGRGLSVWIATTSDASFYLTGFILMRPSIISHVRYLPPALEGSRDPQPGLEARLD